MGGIARSTLLSVELAGQAAAAAGLAGLSSDVSVGSRLALYNRIVDYVQHRRMNCCC